MNYIRHVNNFFLHQQKERQLNAHHISLYMALFQYWNYHRFQNPFPLFREGLMHMSGINSRGTYMKCLKELHHLGYIVYSPGLHKYHQPKVSLLKFPAAMPSNAELPFGDGTGNEGPSPHQPQETTTATIPSPAIVPDLDLFKNRPAPVPDLSSLLIKIDTVPGPDLGHFNKQLLNNVNSERGAPAPGPPLKKDQENKANAPRAPRAAAPAIPPAYEAVQAWFTKAGYPQKEAPRFFSHYQANGWKQGGKVPITNWQAAADKWMSYAQEIKINPHTNNGTDHLHVQQHKNYAEPL